MFQFLLLDNRIGPTLNDARSTSATGFNLSPPGMGPIGNSSPLGSSFSLASNFVGRQLQSVPQQPSVSGNAFFDSFGQQQSAQQLNGPQPQTQNAQFANPMAMEVHRLREENTLQKNTLMSYEEKLSQVIQVSRCRLCIES